MARFDRQRLLGPGPQHLEVAATPGDAQHHTDRRDGSDFVAKRQRRVDGALGDLNRSLESPGLEEHAGLDAPGAR
ncbi:hypothetical protein BH18ACT2_BH18ACT2_10150 [soil metagenome]